MQNLVVVSHTVSAHVVGRKISGLYRAPPIRTDGGVADPQTHATPQICHHTKFRRSRSNRWAWVGSQNFRVRWKPKPKRPESHKRQSPGHAAVSLSVNQTTHVEAAIDNV